MCRGWESNTRLTGAPDGADGGGGDDAWALSWINETCKLSEWRRGWGHCSHLVPSRCHRGADLELGPQKRDRHCQTKAGLGLKEAVSKGEPGLGWEEPWHPCTDQGVSADTALWTVTSQAIRSSLLKVTGVQRSGEGRTHQKGCLSGQSRCLSDVLTKGSYYRDGQGNPESSPIFLMQNEEKATIWHRGDEGSQSRGQRERYG